jgi:hypothetical protein
MIYTSDARAIELNDMGVENNPFVAWSNLGAAATLGGTGVLTGGDRANAVTGSTYDKWRPNVTTAEASLSFDFGGATNISFAAVASHNAHTFGAACVLQYSSNGSSWTDAGSITPADASVMAWRTSTAQTARYWRFNFTGLTSGDALSVGVAFMGNDLVIPRRFYQGFSPVLSPTEVELQSNVSVGGHLLGSSVVERGSTLTASLANIPADFIRGADWLAYQTAANEGKGFFFGWRPFKYAQDVHYCWRDGPVIRPTNSGPRDLMGFDIQARVFNG